MDEEEEIDSSPEEALEEEDFLLFFLSLKIVVNSSDMLDFTPFLFYLKSS